MMNAGRRTRLLGAALAAALFALTALASPGAEEKRGNDFDVLIRGAMIYDGSGGPPFRGDIGVKDGRIARLGPAVRGAAVRTIDARGLAAMPGFIDMHTHVDEDMVFPEHRAALNYLTQGVTTVVVGQCGGSAWPFFEKAKDQVARFTGEGVGPNVALLVGHGTVRRLVMGMDDRTPTADELEKMKSLVREAMEQGASGLSTGLIYLPGTFAKTDEVVELAKIIAPFGGIYHTHVRNERDKLLEAVGEAIDIGRLAGVPVHISHFKVMGRDNWGLVGRACALVEEARAGGMRVTADQYPFRFSNGNPYAVLIPRTAWLGPSAGDVVGEADTVAILGALRDAELVRLHEKLTPHFPLSPTHRAFLDSLTRRQLVSLVAEEVNLGGRRGIESDRERAFFLRRWEDAGEREKIRKAVRAHIEGGVGAENWVVGVCADRSLEGVTLREAAGRWKTSIEDAAVRLELMGARCVPLQMCEPDIETIMARDYVATGSDGGSPHFGVGLPHIRSYSTFLYKIKEYALKRKVISLARAVRSQTALPAEIMDWPDRGRIREGCAADIVLLDVKNIETPATVTTPHAYARGVRFLLVNGRLALDGGEWTGVYSGRVLKPAKTALP
jgi:N-acyl-D-aspartate/D-glutamate deacylase